ncbi:MAG TPA: 3-deoxy-manno-octulosonate cytidylyltransferase [Nitrospiria bacterium]|nr:3-deoxy-manno-octulosonate cytidylyltransferase [Nitrospiria bacterium]
MEPNRKAGFIMRTVIVIPCRFDSSRLPGKPLMNLSGKPLIQWVYERALLSKEAAQVVVATDDPRIEETVRSFGGEVITTGSTARTGSDRVAELAGRVSADAYLNLQGDELIFDGTILDELIRSFDAAQPLDMGTLKREITDRAEVSNPNVVKVVTDEDGFALYFSRSPIPYLRSAPTQLPPKTFYKHLGLYIFERETLKMFSSLPSGFLEGHEKLEQLRALEHGIRIKVWETNHDSLRVDTREDLKQAEGLLSKKRLR